MLYLLRLLLVLAIVAGLGYAGLWALGQFVVPESRENVQPVPMPRPKS